MEVMFPPPERRPAQSKRITAKHEGCLSLDTFLEKNAECERKIAEKKEAMKKEKAALALQRKITKAAAKAGAKEETRKQKEEAKKAATAWQAPKRQALEHASSHTPTGAPATVADKQNVAAVHPGPPGSHPPVFRCDTPGCNLDFFDRCEDCGGSFCRMHSVHANANV